MKYLRTVPLACASMSAVVACLLLLPACGRKDQRSSGVAGEKPAASAQPLDRLTWNMKTLVEPYETAGFSGPAWDAPAKQALAAFASMRSGVPVNGAPWSEVIATNCTLAIAAGCSDPMIEYLHLRFATDESTDHKAVATAFRNVAMRMQETKYPPVRKFYTSRRAAEWFYHAYGSRADPAPIREILGGAFYLPETLGDPGIPIEEAYDICRETIDAYEGTKDLGKYQEIYQRMAAPMFAKWPEDYRPWVIKGSAYIRMAWIHRGSAYADTVTERGWEGFRESLDTAGQALERAWELNPNVSEIAVRMLRVELGEGQGRERMELWFNRAMAIDTNLLEACTSKLFYLEPKWHGSEELLLAFGRQCVESTDWGGHIPLVLLNAHEAIARYLDTEEEKAAYWKRTEVWLDVQDAFERFFELNPHQTGWYHNYAWYASRCERWDKVKELIPKLGPINYSFFGGKQRYDWMVQLADLNAAQTPPDTLTVEIELSRMNARLADKISLGQDTPDGLADELKRFDALAAKYRDATPDERASILVSKAMVYLEILDDAETGKQWIARVKQEFPGSRAAQSAGQALAFLTAQIEKQKIRDTLTPGEPFPDFSGIDLDGRPLSVAQHKGKIVLIDFWATWCGPCIAELPNVLSVYEKYHDQGFEIIGVSLDEDRAQLETFLKRQPLAWPQHFDGEGWNSPVAVRYGVDAIPTTYLLDREGRIIARDPRGDELARIVERALSSK